MRVVVGFGARTSVDAARVLDAILAVLQPDWRVEAVASIDRKVELVAAVASSMGVRGVTYSAEELAAVPTTRSSQRVHDAVGTSSVAEAAALLFGRSRRLLTARTSGATVTVAIAAVRDGAANPRD